MRRGRLAAHERRPKKGLILATPLAVDRERRRGSGTEQRRQPKRGADEVVELCAEGVGTNGRRAQLPIGKPARLTVTDLGDLRCELESPGVAEKTLVDELRARLEAVQHCPAGLGVHLTEIVLAHDHIDRHERIGSSSARDRDFDSLKEIALIQRTLRVDQLALAVEIAGVEAEQFENCRVTELARRACEGLVDDV